MCKHEEGMSLDSQCPCESQEWCDTGLYVIPSVDEGEMDETWELVAS